MNTNLLTFRDVVRSSAVFVVVLLVMAYILFQARFLIIGPQIVLTSNPSQMQNERTIELVGHTDNISHLWLNGRAIFTDPQGNFSTRVVLENGYSEVTLEAQDRYGRRTTLTRSFVYSPLTFTAQ